MITYLETIATNENINPFYSWRFALLLGLLPLFSFIAYILYKISHRKSAAEVFADEVHLAFKSGDINQIENQISNSIDLNKKDKDELSLWVKITEKYYAGDSYSYEYFEDEEKYPHYEYVLKYLIKKGLDINDVRQLNYFHNERLFKFLIDNGIDVNYKRDDGLTMLHEAAVGSWWEHAEIFLKNNADVNSLNNDSKTPLDLCYEDQPPDEEWHENAKKMENVLRKHGAKRAEEL